MKAFKKEIYWQCDLIAMKKSNIACVHRRNISRYDSGERCGPWASCFAANGLSVLSHFTYYNLFHHILGVL
jgi:hypothetical protein